MHEAAETTNLGGVECIVIHPDNEGGVGLFARRRDDDPLRARLDVPAAASRLVKRPVDSITTSTFSPPHRSPSGPSLSKTVIHVRRRGSPLSVLAPRLQAGRRSSRSGGGARSPRARRGRLWRHLDPGPLPALPQAQNGPEEVLPIRPKPLMPIRTVKSITSLAGALSSGFYGRTRTLSLTWRRLRKTSPSARDAESSTPSSFGSCSRNPCGGAIRDDEGDVVGELPESRARPCQLATTSTGTSCSRSDRSSLATSNPASRAAARAGSPT